MLTGFPCFSQVGVGMCMEGIDQNPVVYELMSEMAFRSDKVQVQVIKDIFHALMFNDNPHPCSFLILFSGTMWDHNYNLLVNLKMSIH